MPSEAIDFGAFKEAKEKAAAARKSIDSHERLASGGGGPQNPGMEARLAVLEEIAKNTAAALKEIREDLREIRADQRSDFRWTLGIMLTGFGVLLGAFTGLLGVMAHGFHWL